MRKLLAPSRSANRVMMLPLSKTKDITLKSVKNERRLLDLSISEAVRVKLLMIRNNK